MKWTTRVLGYLAIVLFGLVSGYMLRNWQVSPVLDSYQQMINHPLEACRALLSLDQERNGIVATPQTPQQQPQQQPQQKEPATKGNDGKH
jgi:hypothetical protein